MKSNVAMRLWVAAVTLATLALVAQGEPVALPGERGYEVNAANAKELGYEVRVEVPDDAEPQFKRIHVKFPEAVGELRYSHSSVIYSSQGKRILSFSPESYPTLPASDQKELYVLVREDALPCVSFVNVYLGKSDNTDHPPTRYIDVNLASFVFDKPVKCEGKIDARNFY